MTDTLGRTKSAATLNWYGVKYSAFLALEASSSSLKVNFFDISLQNRYSYKLSNPLLWTDLNPIEKHKKDAGKGFCYHVITIYSDIIYLLTPLLLLYYAKMVVMIEQKTM